MSNITYIKGDLFSAPKGSIICHAVNCRGAWGAGIAFQFKRRYPEAYEFYKTICETDDILGTCLLIPVGDHTIGNLFTSWSFGGGVDSEEDILNATREAVKDLLFQNAYPKPRPIHMCKINSGLFGVKWELTEAVLKEFKDQEFVVYEY